MRVIVAGSRHITNASIVNTAILQSGFEITTVVSGGARGVDTLAENYAVLNGIPSLVYKADWEKYGKRAGFLRNTQMSKNADALIAIWDGKSKGTAHMIEVASQEGLPVYIHKVEDQ